MKSNLKKLSEIVARANDLFYSKFDNIDTLMGIMDKNLRKQGMQADAITVDCVTLNKKIVILLHDNKPDVANITLGNKEGCIYSSAEYKLTEISETVMLEIMQKNFT